MALNAADLATMLAACEEHKVQFMDGVMFMHHKRMSKMDALLRSLMLLLAQASTRAVPLAGFKPTYQSPELTPWPKPKSCTNGSASVHVRVPPGATSPLLGGGSTPSKSALVANAMGRCAGSIMMHSPSSPVRPGVRCPRLKSGTPNYP